MTVRLVDPPPPPASLVEHVLWRMTKDTRSAEARVRRHPHGVELAFYLNDSLLWSQVFRGVTAGAQLGELADEKRGEFLALGWSPAQPAAAPARPS